MSTEHRTRLLRGIAHRPRNLLSFTDGDSTISPRHIESYLDSMVAEGLIVLAGDLYHITAAGLAELNKPTTVATARVYCSAQMTEPYRPSWAPVRSGASDHLAHKSLMTWGGDALIEQRRRT